MEYFLHFMERIFRSLESFFRSRVCACPALIGTAGGAGAGGGCRDGRGGGRRATGGTTAFAFGTLPDDAFDLEFKFVHFDFDPFKAGGDAPLVFQLAAGGARHGIGTAEDLGLAQHQEGGAIFIAGDQAAVEAGGWRLEADP